jgi:protein-S-isoprenylcysteine O-methyltransferase Ste14
MFIFAIILMAVSLANGFAYSVGPYHGLSRWFANTLLLLQFPLVHSLLLATPGRRFLSRNNARLSTTWFVLVSAVDLFFTVFLWSPQNHSGAMPSNPTPWILFIGSWLFLGKAIWDAGLGLQLGYLGWLAEYRNKKPVYPDLPEHGLYRVCRHPIYLGFFLVLLTAPVHGSDALYFLAVWGSYCLVGPLFKERRLQKYYTARYAAYRQRVPYMIPMPVWLLWKDRTREK